MPFVNSFGFFVVGLFPQASYEIRTLLSTPEIRHRREVLAQRDKNSINGMVIREEVAEVGELKVELQGEVSVSATSG